MSGTLASFGRSNLEDNSVSDNSGVASQGEGGQPGLIQRADNLLPLLETVPTQQQQIPVISVILPVHPPISPNYSQFRFHPSPSENECQLLGLDRIPGRPLVSCPTSRGLSCSPSTRSHCLFSHTPCPRILSVGITIGIPLHSLCLLLGVSLLAAQCGTTGQKSS